MAKARVESLNPLVTVETLSQSSVLERQGLDALVQSVDLVCMTDWDRDSLVGFPDVEYKCGLMSHNRSESMTCAED